MSLKTDLSEPPEDLRAFCEAEIESVLDRLYGTALRLTRERVRMIKDRALVRLRVGETGRVLRGFR